MSKLTLDENLRDKLNGLNEQIEVCDESGQTVGHFVPDVLYRKLMYAYDICPYPPEEMERRRRETGGRPLVDILRDLEKQA